MGDTGRKPPIRKPPISWIQEFYALDDGMVIVILAKFWNSKFCKTVISCGFCVAVAVLKNAHSGVW